MELHDKLKQFIKNNPTLIGLENVIDVEEEVPCKRANGQDYCRPDLVFQLMRGDYVVVEVKSHPNCLRKLHKQLRRAYTYFLQSRDIRVRTIGVYLTEKGKIAWYEQKIRYYEHAFPEHRRLEITK